MVCYLIVASQIHRFPSNFPSFPFYYLLFCSQVETVRKKSEEGNHNTNCKFASDKGFGPGVRICYMAQVCEGSVGGISLIAHWSLGFPWSGSGATWGLRGWWELAADGEQRVKPCAWLFSSLLNESMNATTKRQAHQIWNKLPVLDSLPLFFLSQIRGRF